MNEPRLIEIRRVTGTIHVETGLHIGGSQETMEISGLDNPIIRNPANGEPYIPGSSLKGRMRSLAEWYFGEIPPGGNVIHADALGQTAKVFGISAMDPKNPKNAGNPDRQQAYQRGPTRLVVRDAFLTDASRAEFKEGRPLTEVKSENSINRLTSMANPRPMERVLPGVRFRMELLYRVFALPQNGQPDGGEADRRLFDDVVLTALALVEADALGGGSSRGNGKIRFDEDLSMTVGDRPPERLTLPNLTFASAADAG